MKKFSLLLTMVMLVSLIGVASPAPVAADPIPGTIVQIPVIQVGSGWETWIQVQNTGTAAGKFALLLFRGRYTEYCGPQCEAPGKLEMSGLVPVGAAWTYKLAAANTVDCSYVAFQPKSAILLSLSSTQWLAVEGMTCSAAITYLYGLFMGRTVVPAGPPGGQLAAVSVNRILTTGTPSSAAYTGIYGDMEGAREGRTGAYMYYAPMLFDTYSATGWSSTIWIQNSGNECTSLEVWLQKQQACLKNQILEVLALCPGETVKIDLTDPKWGVTPDFMGSAWIRASQPLGVIVDEYNANGSILMSYRGMPATLWNQQGADPPIFNMGSLFNFAPLIYREYNGWNAGIRVQNLSSVYNALVKVYFLDNSGDIIDTIVEWICPRGSQTFYLPAINTLPGQYVGQARVESQNWWSPGDPYVNAPYVLSVVNLVNYISGQGAAYNAFPKQEALEPYVKWVGLPFLAKDKHDPYEPTGSKWTSEIAMTNLDMLPGVSTWRIDFFDQNGLLYSLCQTLNEKQVDYIKLANIGIIPVGWLGSAIISFQCSSGTNPITGVRVGALGVVVVERASGYPSGDLTKVYEGFPLATAPIIPAAVLCPECVQLCPNHTYGYVYLTPEVSAPGLANTMVELLSGARVVDTTWTDSAGYYDFDNVPTGAYTVRASRTNYRTRTSDSFTIACLASSFGLVPALTLNLCPAITIQGFATVTPGAAPLVGKTVELWTGTAANPGLLIASTTTSSEGFYKFTSVACNSYHLKIRYMCGTNEVSWPSDPFDTWAVTSPYVRSVVVNLLACTAAW